MLIKCKTFFKLKIQIIIYLTSMFAYQTPIVQALGVTFLDEKVWSEPEK